MEVKGLSKKLDKNIILPNFAETLESFCEQMLPNGHRDGDKWICGSLQDDEGDSCAIWLNSGTFNDSNPTAEHVKGGPADLWRALFGEMSFPAALRGMERWMKDGTLPDGAQGRPTKNTSSKKRSLSERREELLQDIARLNEGVKEREKELKWLGESDCKQKGDWNSPCWISKKDTKTFLAAHRAHLNRYQTQLDVTDWLMLPPEERLSVYVQDVTEQSEVLSRICQWRAISPDTFHWLAQHRYFGIGTHYWFENDAEMFSEEGKLSPGVWCQKTAVFPIYNEQGKLTSFHHRVLPNGAWQPKVPWFVEPAGEKLSPMIIGDVSTADLVVIAESTWDIIAYIDLRGLCQETGWAAIATRGASNAQRLPAALIKQDAVVLRLLQNDAGNAAWVMSLPTMPQVEHREIRPPDGIKDLNDWMREAGSATQITHQ
jgi:hypothetical protein